MRRKLCGITGLSLVTIATIIAAHSIAQASLIYAGGYLILSGVCGVLITYVFCAKCPIKTVCAHIIPGLLARIWPDKQGPYTRWELFFTAVLFALIILPPQGFLVTEWKSGIIFWFCIIGACLCSSCYLCPDCENRFCPFSGSAR